jgi:hypothetical protein
VAPVLVTVVAPRIVTFSAPPKSITCPRVSGAVAESAMRTKARVFRAAAMFSILSLEQVAYAGGSFL